MWKNKTELNYPFDIRKISGLFLERKNRFIVTAMVNGKEKLCYLPNPGRLWELLIPEETELMLVENTNSQKLSFTVLACKKDNKWVLLHTHLTNKVIKFLINNDILSVYNSFKVISEEVRVHNSRFDLLLENGAEKLYLEVKTCTLFGQKIAMFPDAVTERGRKHLIELKNLAERGTKASVLFVVMNPDIEYFIPAYHIDYEFAKAFVAVKDMIDIRAIALNWDSSFTFVNSVKELKIPFSFIEKALNDSGVYMLVIFLEKAELITIGHREERHFQPGYYVYVGKAKKGLFKRIARHRRKLKKVHWHIDYFLNRAKVIRDLPIITDKDIECTLASHLSKISDDLIPHFGSSDCYCPSHLFYFKENPIFKKEFIEILNWFRIDMLTII